MSSLKSAVAMLTAPKNLITFLITLVLALGEWRYGIVGGYDKLALTLGTAVGCEIALSLFLLGKFPMLSSAYISGISLSILVRPAAGITWPFVVGPLIAIGSKYVVRYRGRHLWNPSNLSIALFVLLAPNSVAILSHEFGNDLAVNAVIWGFGIAIVTRAKVLHVTVTYVLSFLALAAVRSAVNGAPLAAEVAPLTGPMYQLMIFFMLTDPRTSVGSRRGRIGVVALIALVEAAIRLGNDFHVPGAALFAPAPPILALTLVGPAALAIDLRLRARRARNQAPQPLAAAVDSNSSVTPGASGARGVRGARGARGIGSGAA